MGQRQLRSSLFSSSPQCLKGTELDGVTDHMWLQPAVRLAKQTAASPGVNFLQRHR